MELTAGLDRLHSELQLFTCRPRTLVSDLVLVALATDLFETGLAVHDTARSALPHKAYSNARLAFETAQNLLVLATHEEYEVAGAVAWVYFEWKDASWRAAVERRRSPRGDFGPTEDQWLEGRVDQMARIWSSVAEDQGRLLRDALARVRRDRKKKPDNWLHESMTARQHRAYALFAANRGSSLQADSVDLNQRMYQVLCRETHARPRLDSFGIIHDRARDTVRIDMLPRNLEQARYAVTAGTELSVSEGASALRWQRTGAV